MAITYGIILFTALIHLDVVLAFMGHVGHILLPVLVGLLLAFDIDMRGPGLNLADYCRYSGGHPNGQEYYCAGRGALAGSVASAATSTVSTVVQVLIGFVMALYILMDRENLARQSKKLLYANIKTSAADKICEICSLIKDSYTKYLSGQCIEAVILGTLILTTFVIFHIPYATLMAMVTSVCALVPYIGATVSCIIAVLLTLLAEPQKALLCLIVYLVVQFVETQFIYPHVVGSSVGLSPLWTLLAVMVGGKLCGFVGVIFFIPLTAALKTVDFIVDGIDRAKCATIITTNPKEVCEALSAEFESGMTTIAARGAYSRQEKTMVYFVLNRFQVTRMRLL